MATEYLKEGASVTKELNLQSYFILINLKLKSHMKLMAPTLYSIGLEK